MHGWKRWALVGGITVVALGVGGPFVYLNFIQDDPPPPLTIDSSTTVAPGTSTTPTTPTTLLPSLDGTWKVASGSTAGYRVKETLLGQSATAVGRTEAVTGDLTLTGTEVGAASFSVDMTQVTSSESRRDGQFQGRIMDTAQFPTATFELTTPIELGAIPARDVEIKPKATGTLTLHGTDRTVTVALTAKWVGNNIRILGSIPITFADYNIDNPSGGPASVGDSGTLEFLLVLSKAS